MELLERKLMDERRDRIERGEMTVRVYYHGFDFIINALSTLSHWFEVYNLSSLS